VRIIDLISEAPRILILNSPSNPTGCVYNEEELKAVADVARKYRMLVISDEIYSELHHSGDHYSISRFYPEGTIVSGGLSKWCGAGGWRMGFWLFPSSMAWLRKSMLVMASETYTSVASPIQHAARRAFVPEYVSRSWLPQAH
jgi:aspartate aminotransferase